MIQGMAVTETPARYVRAMEQVPDTATSMSAEPIDVTPLLGTWHNTNHRTWGIARAEITRRDDGLWLHVWTADPIDGPHDWGEAAASVYTDGPFSNRAAGFTATFELGHARTHLQAYTDHGLTIIAAFTTFLDDSGRSNYFSREPFTRW